MHVFMTTDGVGGVWTYSLDLARGLCRRGMTVTLAVLGPAGRSGDAARNPGLSVMTTGLPLDWLASGPDVVRQSAERLAALAPPGIVHLHAPALAAFGRFAAPVIVGCHSCLATWWEAVYGTGLPPHLRWQAVLAADGYARADALIAPSHAFAAATGAVYGANPAVVHNGRAACSLPCDAPMQDFVFTSGRLWDGGKNAAVLDAAACLLPWPVFAAGPLDGPDGSVAAFAHLQPLGWLDAAGIAAQLAHRPVYASAARYEPFGLGVLEAAQAGCALVLSDIGSFRELWEGAACFVAPDDAAGFAAAIAKLMRDPAHRAVLGGGARARAARYTADAMTAGTVAVYERCMALA